MFKQTLAALGLALGVSLAAAPAAYAHGEPGYGHADAYGGPVRHYDARDAWREHEMRREAWREHMRHEAWRRHRWEARERWGYGYGHHRPYWERPYNW